MSAVMIGRFTPEQSEALRMALGRAELPCRHASDGASARRMLKEPSGRSPRLIVVDAAMAELEALMTWLRGDAALFGTMVVAVVPGANDHAFSEAHALGCDDVVVQGDLGGITRRGAALATYDPTARPPTTQGRALVAHPSDHRRRLLGRALRLAGFDVDFAMTGADLIELAERTPTPALVVAAESLPARGALDAIAATREACGQARLPAVIVGSEAERRDIVGREELQPIAAIAEQAPPDRLLFVANELLRPGVRNLRASPRVLYDALCAFRPAGQLQPVLGLTYNLSREGLYVRTLDPLPAGTAVWFEVRPPGEREVVHLRGTVVWARRMDRGPGGAAPPGFGLRFVDDACPPADLRRYQEAYEEAARRATAGEG